MAIRTKIEKERRTTKLLLQNNVKTATLLQMEGRNMLMVFLVRVIQGSYATLTVGNTPGPLSSTQLDGRFPSLGAATAVPCFQEVFTALEACVPLCVGGQAILLLILVDHDLETLAM